MQIAVRLVEDSEEGVRRKFVEDRAMSVPGRLRFICSFQEILESVGVRDQARFVEVSTTAVTRAMIIFVSTRCPISKNEAIGKVNFKRRGLIWKI